MTTQLKAMPKKQYDLLLQICNVQSCSANEKRMILFLANYLSSMELEYYIDAPGNMIVTKGQTDLYPCIVAHMDTVHSIVDDYHLYYYDDDKTNHRHLFAKSYDRATGIGGDDKCGIFACLYMLKHFENLKVVFFSKEESGLIGSGNIRHDFFDDCMYILQLDRRYGSDFIDSTYNGKTISKDFASEVGHLKKKYGFKSAKGTITDCIKLWNNKIGISCVNISSGYYNPHTANEYIDIQELWNSTLFARDIITNINSKRYLSLPEPIKTPTYNTGYSGYSGYSWSKNRQCVVCNILKNTNTEGELIRGKFICNICLETINKLKCKCNKCRKDIDLDKQEGIVSWENQFLDTAHPNYLILCNECYTVELGDYNLSHTNCQHCHKEFGFADLNWDSYKKKWSCFHCLLKGFEDKSTSITPRILLRCDICNTFKDKSTGVENIEGCTFICSDCMDYMELTIKENEKERTDTINEFKDKTKDDTTDTPDES